MDWKELRRLRAWTLNQQGWRPCDIAEFFGVSKGAVSQWLSAARQHGPEGLSARPLPGAVPKLSEDQKQLLPEFLRHGAEAYGFRGDVWTCRRVAAVIEQEYGVRYHKDHVSRILKDLDWTPQKPVRRALQRDEARIERWRTEVWPELKKRPALSAGPWFLPMNRASTCCPVLSPPMGRGGKLRCFASGRVVTTCRLSAVSLPRESCTAVSRTAQ